MITALFINGITVDIQNGGCSLLYTLIVRVVGSKDGRGVTNLSGTHLNNACSGL